MSLRIPLKSGKPENTQISEIESYGGSSISMEKDREWPEDDMDWSFKIQDEKQLEQCLQMKTDDIHWDIFKDAYECPGAIKVEVWSWETLMGERSFFYVERPLTAAILLNNQAETEKFVEEQPVIMSPGLESAIAFLNEERTEKFIKEYGELASQVRLSAIYEAQNTTLLKYYIKTHRSRDLQELRTYLEWLNNRRKDKKSIERKLYEWNAYNENENFWFFKLFVRTFEIEREPDIIIIRDIQRRLLDYLSRTIMAEGEMCEIFWTNLNWDDLNDMDKPDAINCVQYFMLLTQKYGPVDVSDKVYDFVDDGVYVLDMIKLKSGVRKNFVALHQYEVEMPESRQKESVIQKKWTKRLMHYAVPDKLREETDPITEWIIKKNDRKLIKYAIKQKYIGKENAGKLLEYAFSLKNVETDDWIIELLTEEMTGHKQQSVEKSVKTQ